MAIHLRGILRGRRIELEGETGLPDGAKVEVTIDASPVTEDERSRALRALAGSWKSDDSIPSIFDAILIARTHAQPRPADFDAAS